MIFSPNTLHQGDCINLLPRVPAGSVDLAFCDPPWNIGYSYDQYDDRKTDEEYLEWSRKWIGRLRATLKPTGTFWLAIHDRYASDLDVLCRRTFGFHRRSWVVHHFSFGVNQKRGFTPSKAHFFHYVMDRDRFTFNDDAIRVPSMRQLKYADKRANSKGRLPNDVWVLDSKQASDERRCFLPSDDVWFESRLCGTFKERTGHPCQLPEPILERIILSTSNPGDLVADVMAGSGTTLSVAQRLGRNWLGMELSPAYCEIIRKRLGIKTKEAV